MGIEMFILITIFADKPIQVFWNAFFPIQRLIEIKLLFRVYNVLPFPFCIYK